MRSCAVLRGALPFLLCATHLGATTLVAVWSPDQLIIGADSSAITSLGAVAIQASACKIGQQGSTFYAFTGLVEDQAAGFHAAPLAERAVRSAASLPERVARFVEIARAPLAEAVARLKSDSSGDDEYLQQGHPALQAIFVEAGQGAPSLAIVGFSVAPGGSVSTFVKMVADGDDGRGPRIIYAGQQSHIREYLSSHRDWYTGDVPDLVS